MGLSLDRLTRPRNTMVTNFFIIAPLDVAGKKPSRYAIPPDEELGSRQRCCRGDLRGKEREKKGKNPSRLQRGRRGEVEGDGGAVRGGLRLAAEGGGGRRGGRRHVPPLEIRTFASGSELLMEEGGSQP